MMILPLKVADAEKAVNRVMRALMIAAVTEISRVAWNINQRRWESDDGKCCSCCEWITPTPIVLGDLTVSVKRSDEYDSWATFTFHDQSITSEISGKRLFQYSTTTMTEAQLLQWWNVLMDHLNSLDRSARA